MEPHVKRHIVDTELCGPVSCYLQGDLEKQREGVVFLTVHDIGCTFINWYNFVMEPAMNDIRSRALFIHVSVPGQEPGAENLPGSFKFPKMQDLGLNLVSILDNLRIPRVIALGNGAGGNIITRFGMLHPNRVHGIVAINTSTSTSMGRFMERLSERMSNIKTDDANRLNKKNVEIFAEAYKKRSAIIQDLNKKIKVDVLLIAGAKSKCVADADSFHQEMLPGLCSIIKIEEVCEPLIEAVDRVTDAVLLFCQGIGLMASLIRRPSRQGSLSNAGGNDKRERQLIDPSLKHHIITLESCGPLSVFLQGDVERIKDGVVFLTVHDVGSSYRSWKNFVNLDCLEDVRKRSIFVHVAIPGQEPGAVDLPHDFVFPKMKDLGLYLVSVLDFLRVKQVVGLGDGAGANIITRFGMNHPSRVHGVFTINNRCGVSLGRFMEGLKGKMKTTKGDEAQTMNESNVAQFAEAYKKRTEILTDMHKKINFDLFLMTGLKSKYVEDTEAIHQQIQPGLCSMIKVEDVVEPLNEASERVAEALILFCQGLGLMASVVRKFSRQQSLSSQDSLVEER